MTPSRSDWLFIVGSYGGLVLLVLLCLLAGTWLGR